MKLILIFIVVLLSSCATIKKIEIDKVAESFSEKAIGQAFGIPNFTFKNDSIQLEGEVDYDKLNTILFSKAEKFTPKGVFIYSTLKIYISVEWSYLPEKRKTYLSFKRIWKT